MKTSKFCECGGEFIYYKGERESFDSPGYADEFKCEICGVSVYEIEGIITCGADMPITKLDIPLSVGVEGVSISGFAEGFDGEFPSIVIPYPFNIDDFWEAVNKLDKLSTIVRKLANPDFDNTATEPFIETTMSDNHEYISSILVDFAIYGDLPTT